MIYEIYRKLTSVFLAFLILIMGTVLSFQKLLPNSFYVSDSELEFSSSYGKFITFNADYGTAEEVLSTNRISCNFNAKLLGIFPLKEVSAYYTDEKIVTVCGTPFGVKMFTDGVLVVGFSNIETVDGVCCPAKDSGLIKGDVLKRINKKDVFTNEDVSEIIKNSGGETLNMLVLRNGKTVAISVTPKLLNDQSGYKAGFWVRDSSAGIGTLTFFDPDTLSFAGLGHAVCDIDTGVILPFSSGEIVPATITKIKKGISGSPGELGGSFIGSDSLGTVKINSESGLYGKLDYKIEGVNMPIAHKQDIYEGAAVILSTIDGTSPEEYEIIIEKVNISDDSSTKNMIIKVVDEELLSKTGGIVQGMSGSPIIQDGKLIGAVTHVLVNQPDTGYGIFIENMLEILG